MESETFFQVLRGGDAEAVAAALRAEPALAASRDAAGLSAVTWALYNRRSDLVDLLLASGPPLDLFEAAAAGRARDVELHLGRDPEGVRKYASDGFTALHLAAFFARPEVARILIAHGADVSAVARNPSKVQPLHSAAAAGQAEIAAALLRAGAEVDARQHGGFTALHSAAMQGNVALVNVLVAAGADPGAKADDGRTAREMASEKADVVRAALGA